MGGSTKHLKQLAINPVSLKIAQSSFGGTHLSIYQGNASRWSDVAFTLDIRYSAKRDSVETEPRSLGVTWRFVDDDNHYMFYVDPKCGVTKDREDCGRIQHVIGRGATTLLKNFNFGAKGNYPTLQHTDEFAYVSGTALSSCMGNCRTNSDYVSALQCHIVKVKNGKVPGCTGEGMINWGYCVATSVGLQR